MSDSTSQDPAGRARKRVTRSEAGPPPQSDGGVSLDDACSPEIESAVEAVEASTSDPAPDPNDLSGLWAPTPIIEARQEVTTIRAGVRPPKDKWIQLLPFALGSSGNLSEFKNCRPVLLFEYQFDGELSPTSYYVRPGSAAANALMERERLNSAILVLGAVRHGGKFVWELKIPSGKNKSADKWAESRLQLAKIATTKWIKPVANVEGGGYDYLEPVAEYDPPDWSGLTFDKAIQIACKDRIIADLDHDAVKEVMGL